MRAAALALALAAQPALPLDAPPHCTLPAKPCTGHPTRCCGGPSSSGEGPVAERGGGSSGEGPVADRGGGSCKFTPGPALCDGFAPHDPGNKDASSCAAACCAAGPTQCRAWQYGTQGPHSSATHCWVLNASAPATECRTCNGDWVSGWLGKPPSVPPCPHPPHPTPGPPPPPATGAPNCAYIKESHTGPGVSDYGAPPGHYACVPPHPADPPRLLLFVIALSADDYTEIVQTAAEVGMYAVGLMYQNKP